MLRDAAEVLGAERRVAVCRELTKKFEEVIRGDLGTIAEDLQARSLKGEIVVLIEAGSSQSVNEMDLDRALHEALQGQSVRDAAEFVAAQLGLKKRLVYQRALELGKAQG